MKNNVPDNVPNLQQQPDDYLWLDGKYLKFKNVLRSKAMREKYPFSPRAQHYGGCTWDGTSILVDKEGKIQFHENGDVVIPYFKEATYPRLVASAQTVGIVASEEYPDRLPFPVTADQFYRAFQKLSAKMEGKRRYVRPTLYEAAGTLAVIQPDDVRLAALGELYMLGTKEQGSYYPDAVKVLITSGKYHKPANDPWALAPAKVPGNYPSGNNVKKFAKKYGCHDGLQPYTMIEDGKLYVGEGASNNYCFIQVVDGEPVLVIPRPRKNILFGNTQQAVIYAARTNGLKVIIRDVLMSELENGTFVCAFTTGNASGVKPVELFKLINGKIIEMDVVGPTIPLGGHSRGIIEYLQDILYDVRRDQSHWGKIPFTFKHEIADEDPLSELLA